MPENLVQRRIARILTAFALSIGILPPGDSSAN